jgi:zinc and cadmium transporter
MLLPLVAVSTGVILGDVFLHMVPEMLGREGASSQGALILLLGILVSFSIEKFIHWHHCHILPSKDHYHPVGIMSLAGDALHNIIDGVIIAGSFLVSTKVGLATTLAVALHEIPHEIGNFALLLYSGFSRKQALLWNAVSAAAALVGAGAFLLAAESAGHAAGLVLPFAAGNLLYIAGTDLLPELHKDTHAGRAVLQLFLIAAGIAVMWGFTFIL